MQHLPDNHAQDQRSTDWNTWDAVMLSMIPFLNNKDFGSALNSVEDFMQRQLEDEVKSSALGMRAYLKENLGDVEGAKGDLMEAISLAPLSFGKHVNEVCLAELHKKQGNNGQAEHWYRQALITCAESTNRVSGGHVISKFLELRGQSLNDEDRKLCAVVAERSWRVWNPADQPDLANLDLVAATIMKEERKGDGERKPCYRHLSK